MRSRRALWRSSFLIAVAIAVNGCHTTSTNTRRVSDKPKLVPRPGTEQAQQPTVVLAGDSLRFITPLRCTADVTRTRTLYRVTRTGPNIGTVVVGVIAASAGFISGFVGLSSEQPSEALSTYAGAAGVVIGLPLTILPFIGNAESSKLIGSDTVADGTGVAPCGERGLGVGPVTVNAIGATIYGTVDASGTFSVPVFDFLDAFALHEIRGAEFTVHTDRQRFSTVMHATKLAEGRTPFFARRNVEDTVQPMHKVPRLRIGSIHVQRHESAFRLSVHVQNDGPGIAYRVRARVASGDPRLDGRVLYFGHVTARSNAAVSLDIPVRDARSPLTDGVRVRLLDEHNTAPTTPTVWREPATPSR